MRLSILYDFTWLLFVVTLFVEVIKKIQKYGILADNEIEPAHGIARLQAVENDAIRPTDGELEYLNLKSRYRITFYITPCKCWLLYIFVAIVACTYNFVYQSYCIKMFLVIVACTYEFFLQNLRELSQKLESSPFFKKQMK